MRINRKSVLFGIFLIVIGVFCMKAYVDRTQLMFLSAVEGVDSMKEAGTQKINPTLGAELATEGIPLLFQTDVRWKDTPYGNGLIELKGCGPTCLSMVAAGLLRDEKLTPIYIAEKSEEWGYIEGNSGTSWRLMTAGAQELGLASREIPLSESKMKAALDSGKPIICAMGPGDFTDEGHFIVLTGYTTKGFTIHDPNSEERSNEIWDYEDIKHQIRNIWSFEAMP